MAIPHPKGPSPPGKPSAPARANAAYDRTCPCPCEERRHLVAPLIRAHLRPWRCSLGRELTDDCACPERARSGGGATWLTSPHACSGRGNFALGSATRSSQGSLATWHTPAPARANAAWNGRGGEDRTPVHECAPAQGDRTPVHDAHLRERTDRRSAPAHRTSFACRCVRVKGNTYALAIVYAHPRMLGNSHLRSSALRPTLPPRGHLSTHCHLRGNTKGVTLNTSTPQGVAHVCLDSPPTPGKPLGLPPSPYTPPV